MVYDVGAASDRNVAITVATRLGSGRVARGRCRYLAPGLNPPCFTAL